MSTSMEELDMLTDVSNQVLGYDRMQVKIEPDENFTQETFPVGSDQDQYEDGSCEEKYSSSVFEGTTAALGVHHRVSKQAGEGMAMFFNPDALRTEHLSGSNGPDSAVTMAIPGIADHSSLGNRVVPGRTANLSTLCESQLTEPSPTTIHVSNIQGGLVSQQTPVAHIRVTRPLRPSQPPLRSPVKARRGRGRPLDFFICRITCLDSQRDNVHHVDLEKLNREGFGIPECEQKNGRRGQTKIPIDWTDRQFKQYILDLFPRLLDFIMLRSDQGRKLHVISPEINTPLLLRKVLGRSQLYVCPVGDVKPKANDDWEREMEVQKSDYLDDIRQTQLQTTLDHTQSTWSNHSTFSANIETARLEASNVSIRTTKVNTVYNSGETDCLSSGSSTEDNLIWTTSETETPRAALIRKSPAVKQYPDGHNVHSSKKISQFKVTGLIAAPLTPMKKNWEVNYDLFPECAQKIADGGMTGVFINGTMGEGPAMTVEERKLATEAWVKAGEGRLKFIVAQVGAGNMHESIELAKHAEKMGVSAIACLCPTYFKPSTAEGLVLYMKQVAAAAPNTPFYLYEINQMTSCPVSVDKFFQLARDEIATLRGMKYSNLYPPVGYNVAQMEGGRYQVLAGSDEQYLSYLSLGIDVDIVSSYVGFLAVRLEAAFKAGDMERARKEQARLQTLSNLLKYRGWDMSVVKAIGSAAMGIEMGPARPPWVPLKQEIKEEIKQKLRDTGYFDWMNQ